MRGAASRRMKIDGWALAPSPSLPHAVVQVRRAFRRAFVKMRRRHGGEGEGSECVAGTLQGRGHAIEPYFQDRGSYLCSSRLPCYWWKTTI